MADGPMLSAAAELINQILRSCFVQCIGKKTGGRVSHGGATASLDVSMAVRFGHRVSRSKLKFKCVFENERVG